MGFTTNNILARRVAQAVGLAGIAVGAVAVAAMFTDSPINPLIAAASFVPLLLVVTVVTAVICLVFRRWILLAVSAVLIGLAASVVSPLYVANGQDVDGPSLRVMQANLLFGAADPASLVEEVRTRNVDVLTVQELTVTLASALRDQGLDETLPYSYAIPDESGGGGAGIYSRYPLSDTRELNGYGPTNLAATVGFSTPFTLLAVHPGPAYVTPPDVWTTELKNLRDALAGTDGNVVVSGDFNTTYLHKQFRELLAAGYTDAADRLGMGIVPTYPADKPYPAIVGIDHVLTKGAQATSLERIEIEGSDHHGLIVDVVIPS
ncbi:endonuclease/exonuclease/phosphatase family protein [Rhodococcoides yunnanense]|uniref:endonuclease/exonuclease/phosphatase family protein n=1 Tax=Rhodococcoides yunnanense TaxID=278209 RepID=UPI00093445D2|nr:endonuclease/exonuclease/phosphatase family protein [Rhodococcus yunnanensis]